MLMMTMTMVLSMAIVMIMVVMLTVASDWQRHGAMLTMMTVITTSFFTTNRSATNRCPRHASTSGSPVQFRPASTATPPRP